MTFSPHPSLQALSPATAGGVGGGAGRSTHRVRGQGGRDEPTETEYDGDPPSLFTSIKRLFFLAPRFVSDGNVEVPEPRGCRGVCPASGGGGGGSRACSGGLLPLRQGCGSHARTLGDIFVLSHTPSHFLPEPRGST